MILYILTAKRNGVSAPVFNNSAFGRKAALMWQNQLSKIRKIEGTYEDALNLPASNDQIEIIKKTVKEKFNHVVFFGESNISWYCYDLLNESMSNWITRRGH